MPHKDKNLIKRCAKLCVLSYQDAFDYKDLGYNTHTFIEVRNTEVHVLSDATHSYVVFRGTEPAKIADWITDLRYRFDKNIKSYGVHRGFNVYVNNALDEIKLELSHNEHKSKSLIITGHSLGGAAAVIFAEKVNFVEKVVTFGQPRVGDKRMKEFYTRTDQLIRVVNENDPVTLFPPRIRGYRDFGSCLYFNIKGHIRTEPTLFHKWLSLFFKPRGRFITKNIRNHSMDGAYYKNTSHLL